MIAYFHKWAARKSSRKHVFSGWSYMFRCNVAVHDSVALTIDILLDPTYLKATAFALNCQTATTRASNYYELKFLSFLPPLYNLVNSGSMFILTCDIIVLQLDHVTSGLSEWIPFPSSVTYLDSSRKINNCSINIENEMDWLYSCNEQFGNKISNLWSYRHINCLWSKFVLKNSQH